MPEHLATCVLLLYDARDQCARTASVYFRAQIFTLMEVGIYSGGCCRNAIITHHNPIISGEEPTWPGKAARSQPPLPVHNTNTLKTGDITFLIRQGSKLTVDLG